jgi:superfamily II DNA or RNA helicase
VRTLRPYQDRAIAAVLAEYRAGKRACLLVAPTGAGKSTMGAALAARHVARGGRVVWGADREELLEQAAATLRDFGLSVGVRGLGASAPVQVASIPTIARRREAPDCTLYISDEAHHDSHANQRAEILKAYRAAGAFALGMTATPARADGAALAEYDTIVSAASIRELTDAGHLVPLQWRGPRHAMAAGKIARTPYEAWARHAQRPREEWDRLAGGPARAFRPAIVFAPHVKAAEDFAAEFAAHGVRVACVSDRSSAEDRARIVEALRTGLLDVVTNCNVLTEGFDAPRVGCVIVARRCGSQPLWLQMTGRALRPHPESHKRDALLLDLSGLAHELGRPDADRTYHLDGDGIRLAHEVRAPALERLCRVCGCPLGIGDDYARVCPECGKDHTLETPKSVEEEIGEWHQRYEAAKHALHPSRSALALASILRKAQAAADRGKPWKSSAVRFRFQAVFGRGPTSEEMREAISVNQAASGFSLTRAE